MWPHLEIGLLQMQLVNMRSYWSRMGPWSNMTGVLIRRGEDMQWYTCREEGHVRTGRDWSDAAGGHGMPRIAGPHQRLGERHGRCPQSPQKSANLLTPWFQTELPDYERIHFCCFKPPSVWYFVRADSEAPPIRWWVTLSGRTDTCTRLKDECTEAHFNRLDWGFGLRGMWLSG